MMRQGNRGLFGSRHLGRRRVQPSREADQSDPDSNHCGGDVGRGGQSNAFHNKPTGPSATGNPEIEGANV